MGGFFFFFFFYESTGLCRFLQREYDAHAELVIACLECTMLSIDFDIKS